MNVVSASILFSGFKLNVTSTCSLSSSGLVGPVAAGDALGRAAFPVSGEAFGVGVALAVSMGDGLAVGSAIAGEATGAGVEPGVLVGEGFAGGTVSLGCGDSAGAGLTLGDAPGVDVGVG
jgi:hypothetical protein